MASISLHKFDIVPEDEEHHVFTFIFDNPQKLLDVKSLESSEVNYGGQRWSLVCMRKDERFMGIFLKWKYTDGQSASCVSTKAKYSICLVHRHDFSCNKYFNSSQKFSSSQSLLGKSKFIPISDLLDYATGYLDETGKRVVLELTLSRSSSRFEKVVDISPKARTRKNASGYYFDTQTFLMANHRWYLRLYPTKLNSNGLPAAYLYLASKPRGINLDLQFRLYMGQDTTETLSYNFGEGAKFDGFGKTLPHPIYNLERLSEIVAGVEIESVLISKDVLVSLKPHTGALYGNHHMYGGGSHHRGGYKSQGLANVQTNLTHNDAFQDMEGNYWSVELKPDVKNRVTMIFDKGVHHFSQNKTKLLCWSGSLLSRDPTVARDIDMNGECLVGYFSNFIDEKGYMMSFPVELAELENKSSLYTTDNREIVVRINMLSLQTLPVGMRTLPKFEYQGKHLLRYKRMANWKDVPEGEVFEVKYIQKPKQPVCRHHYHHNNHSWAGGGGDLISLITSSDLGDELGSVSDGLPDGLGSVSDGLPNGLGSLSDGLPNILGSVCDGLPNGLGSLSDSLPNRQPLPSSSTSTSILSSPLLHGVTPPPPPSPQHTAGAPVNFLRNNVMRASALSIQSQWKMLQDKERNLEAMREMSASRASLSGLDLSRDDRPMSESSGSDVKVTSFKSYDSLDAMTNGEVIQNGNMFEDDISKGFFSDVLHHVSNLSVSSANQMKSLDDGIYLTSRDVFHGTREDLSTESGVAMSDDSTLFVEARPSPMDLNKQKEVVEVLTRFLQQRLPFRVTEVLEFGSLGSGTSTRSRLDVDLILFSPDLPRDNQEKWMPCLLHAISKHIQNACSNPDPYYPISKCSYFATTPRSVQFSCAGVDVDILVTYDWSNENAAGYDALYNLSCKQTSKAGRFWHSLATARLQKKMISDQPNEIKELIKVVKHWRNCVQWKKAGYRPNSYLLSLLVIKAVEESKSFDMRIVLEKMGSYILMPELMMAWNKFYLPEKFSVEFDPPTPLVRDPANPGYNVAESLSYWGQFSTEYTRWIKGLGMQLICPVN